jgi:hypothetical protein
MITELAHWSKRCSAVLADLEAEIQSIRAESEKRAAREARTERQVKSAMEALGRTPGGGGPGGLGHSGATDARLSGARIGRREQGVFGGGDDLDAMDVDGGSANQNALGSGAGKKKSGGGGGGGGGGVAGMLSQFQKGGGGP